MTSPASVDKVTAGSAPPAPAGNAVASSRLLSLDVFRGGTIAAMVLVNNPGGAAYGPLLHAPWHGWTFTDLVFPFFLWIAGVSMTLSTAKRIDRGEDRRRLWLHVLRRSALIFAIGLFLNGFPSYNWSTIRIPGVLQRIALCYLCASTIYLMTKIRGQVFWIVGLLAVYWMGMMLVPVPGHGAGVLEKDGNLAQYIDQMFLSGHMWGQSKTWDPEGIFSTLPAIATTLFGMLAGALLQSNWKTEEKASWMMCSGALLLFAGAWMDHFLPINKMIWTSSYSVFTAGMAALTFGCVYWLVDLRGCRRFTRPLEMFGMNALALYIFSGLFARMLSLVKFASAEGAAVSLRSILWVNVFQPLGPEKAASLLFALMNVAASFAVAYLMYKRKWVIKL